LLRLTCIQSDHLQKKSTQAFIFGDKEEDTQLVVIAFRGTQAFNADDWETYFDFSWYQFNHMGKVHLGFLEALGLANRSKKTNIYAHHTSYVPPLESTLWWWYIPLQAVWNMPLLQ